MNLRDQLKEILPDILPRNPAQAIKGTELIEMVKHRLKQDYSEATLRYHFSIMSCDPSSPIAKVEQGQGYYLRSSTIHTVNSSRNLFHIADPREESTVMGSSDANVAISRAEKFRAVVQRYLESTQQYPFSFDSSFSTGDAAANRWRVPDLAVIDWMAGVAKDGKLVLDKEKLEVHRRLGRSPLRISSVKLRLELTHAMLFEDLFQCVATSEWANAGELLVAAPIADRVMIEEIRRFASRHGIGVISFGLDGDALDDMPEPGTIANFSDAEFKTIQPLLQIRRYATPSADRDYEWPHVITAAASNADFARFERWITHCLMEERPLLSREFLEIETSPERETAQEFVA